MSDTIGIPRVPRFQVGDAGTAAEVAGLPAMVLAQQPDTMIDAGAVGPLTIRAASVRGAGHRYDGTPRQDDFCLGTGGARGEHLVVVVADGVSAGPRSHLAARVAVRLGVQLLAQALGTGPPEAIDWDVLVGTVAGHVLLQARKDRGDESLDAHAASRVMASTAAFVVVPVEADANGTRVCTVVPIGDTSVWVLRSGVTWEAVTAVKNAGQAVASSATLALPLVPSTTIEPLQVALRHGDALFAVTDGIGDPLGDGAGDVGRALASVWRSPPNRYEFAAQVDLARRSHTDDRTVVGVWPDLDPVPADEPALVAADEPVPAWVDLGPAAPEAPTAAPPGTAPPGAAAPVGGGYGSAGGTSEDTRPSTLVPPMEPPDATPPPTTWAPMPWSPTEWTTNAGAAGTTGTTAATDEGGTEDPSPAPGDPRP